MARNEAISTHANHSSEINLLNEISLVVSVI